MPPSKDWLDSLRADLDIELSGHLPFVKDVWKEVSRQPVQPSRQQVVDEWLHTPQEQLMMLAQQLGPQAYTELVKGKMQAVSEIFDPQIAQSLMQYYMQHVPQQSIQEAEYNAMAGMDNVQPLDLESEVDRFLVEQLAENPN